MNKVEASIGDAEKYLKEQKRTAQSIERLEKSLKENNMNTGGPAFPGTQYANGVQPTGFSQGMTLRDYFAAHAMGVCDDTLRPAYTFNEKAEYAYKMADAMLKAREQ